MAIALVAMPAHAVPAPRDEVLWAALDDLHVRSLDHVLLKAGRYASFAMLAGAGGVLSTYLRGARTPAERLARSISVAVLIPSTVWSAEARYLAASRRQNKLRLSPDEFGTALRDLAIEREYYDDLRAFFKMPRKRQYEFAARYPDLREFVIALDQWMQNGVRTGAPPLAPVWLPEQLRATPPR